MKDVPLFSHCTDLAAPAAEAAEIDVAEGTTLSRQSDRGREFIVIVEGAADVTRMDAESTASVPTTSSARSRS